jgi:hemoglobin
MQLGGWTPLNMAVNLFYDKLLADPLLAPFFEGISMEKLRKKQVLTTLKQSRVQA